MEVDNVYNMCRLCLYRSDNLIDIFEISARHGCIAAEVITDLLRFQVAKEDGYPHVICSRCLDKLNEFKVFKEVCQSLKTTYDNLFSKRRVPVHSQQQMEVVEVLPVKMERIEEEISEEASCHHRSLANEDFITDDTPSELELMRVKAEPDDSLDIEENDPEAMFVPAKARMGEPVSENVDIYPEVSSHTYTDEDETVMQHDPMQMSSAPADSNQAGFPETCKPQAYHRGPETQEQCQKRESELTYIKSQKGRDLLVHSGFLFRFERCHHGVNYWRCINHRSSKCTGRASVSGYRVTKASPHNHPPEPSKIVARVEHETRPRRRRRKQAPDRPSAVCAQAPQVFFAGSTTVAPQDGKLENCLGMKA